MKSRREQINKLDDFYELWISSYVLATSIDILDDVVLSWEEMQLSSEKTDVLFIIHLS